MCWFLLLINFSIIKSLSEAWNMRVSINLTSYASSKPDSVATFSSGIKARNGKKNKSRII